MKEHHYTGDLFGKFIGAGCSRFVFEYAPDPTWVIKLIQIREWQNGGTIENYNYRELKVYEVYKQHGFEHVLAPCKVEHNLFLMKKVEPLKPGKYHIHLSSAAHTEPYNWGLLDGNPVRIDYTHDLVFEGDKAFLPVTKKEIQTSMYYMRKFASPYKDQVKVELNRQTMAMAYENITSTIEIK